MESYVKPNSIRNLQSPDAAQDIDANFDAIFKAVKALRARLGDLEDSTGNDGLEGIQGPPGPPGEDGADGDPGPPGRIGVDGAAGTTGPAGPVTIGLDGDQGEEAFPIPGPIGPQGNPGATGAMGPQAMFALIDDGIPGEDGFPIPGRDGADGVGSGSSWTLIEARTCTGNATEDFTGLSSYNEIRVFTRSITRSAAGTTVQRVSTDNGSTFLSSSGDYVDISNAGADSNQTSIQHHVTSSALARSGEVTIFNFNDGTAPKTWFNHNVTDLGVIPTTTALNAIRILGGGGGTLDAGTIYVWGR